MGAFRQPQRGVYLIVASVTMVVLLGFGALALDLGRLFVLRSQMQNAADAAALAAAAELSRDAGAQARAEAAARNVLEYNGNFAEVAELLGANISLEFFCAIGSKFDPGAGTDTYPSDPPIYPNFCDQDDLLPAGAPDGRYETTLDVQSHYVRVTMDQSVNSDAYSIPLFFLPVLNVFGLNVETQSFLQATAMAGRNYFYSEFPPLMMCNPFESAGQRFQDQMNPGEQIELVDGSASNSWFPGEVGFLALGGTGANANAPFLADESDLNNGDFLFPTLTVETGVNQGPMRNASLTRFDVYPPGSPFSPADYPPDVNVIDYPGDDTDPNTPLVDQFRTSPAEKFGNGHWDRATYWEAYHDWQGYPLPTTPSGQNYITSNAGDPSTGMTRYQMYQWELSESRLPERNPAIQVVGSGVNATCTNTGTTPQEELPDWVCEGASDSIPDATPAPGRRVFTVAVVNCTAQGLTGGRSTFTMFGEEGFARVFLTEVMKSDGKLWGEYIEWAQPGADSNILVDVQLYE